MHVTLTLKLTYDAGMEREQEVRALLDQAAEHLAGEGLLTGETNLVLDQWDHRVEVKP